MSSVPLSPFLRRALLVDAAASGASALLMTLGADFLKELSGLPVSLLFIAGLSLIPFVAFLIYLATRQTVSPRAVWAVIFINALWTADSLLLLLGRWVSPTFLGAAFVIAQAAAVAVFAALEYVGLRRSIDFAASLSREG